MSLDSEFIEPIDLPNNVVATTLRQVIAYINELPDAEQSSQAWQNARERIHQAADRVRVYLVRAYRDHPGTSPGQRNRSLMGSSDASLQETKLESGRANAPTQTGCCRGVTTHGSRGS